MSRLIDADELLTHLNACLTNGRPLSNLYDLSEIVSYVESMPTVDTVKHGKWIKDVTGAEYCSECYKYPYDDGEYHITDWHSDFCPWCGALMDVKEQCDETN